MPLETNLFPITNLDELAAEYRLVRVRGLASDHPEYHENREALQNRLSFLLRAPVVAVPRPDGEYLAIPKDQAPVPADVTLVRAVVTLEPLADTFTLNLRARDPESEAIALRFLRHFLQSPLRAQPTLWQPEAGRPFFERTPRRTVRGVNQFFGYSVRPVITPDGGIALCVDVRSRYVSSAPLPTTLTRDEFNRRWKGRNFVYHYGDDWYEVHPDGLGDGTVVDHKFIAENKRWTLLEYVQTKARKPLTLEVATLSRDASFVLYRNRRGQVLAAPAPLCYEVLTTRPERVAQQHGDTILSPESRRSLVHRFAARYLQNLTLGGRTIHVSVSPLRAETSRLSPPDLRFGNGRVLSVASSAGAEIVTLKDLGRRRLALLRQEGVGFYVQRALDRQYLIIPQSVFDSYGSAFRQDLAAAVAAFVTGAGAYSPEIVPYDDRGRRTFVVQGNAVLAAAKQHCRLPGYALVMLHRLSDAADQEDQLAAMVLYELSRQVDVRAAVIHSDMPGRAYRERMDDGRRAYVRSDPGYGRFNGYLRNVALNHVLLTNQRWPFVLATPLYADVVVGVDVKCNTCGLLSISNDGATIRTLYESSRQKEQLTRAQMQQYLERALREHAASRLMNPIRSIVLHRDGRVWPNEIRGAEAAVGALRTDGTIASNATITTVEIAKSASVPLRFFDVAGPKGHGRVLNPEVGTVFRLSRSDAFLCSTGRSFPRPGTVQPLHVRRVAGPMALQACVADVFALTNLTWTRPEDCARYPITMRLNDRFLVSEAALFNSDALTWGEQESA